ncbi:MAG: hypothetical protein AUK64_2108 [bacterium P201]|nr:MAG: hypothetical protein AUK64_2108 [bacterium P201]
MAEFVSIAEDKFKKKTTYTNTKHLSLEIDSANSIFGWIIESNFNYRRIVEMPDQDDLLFDITVKAWRTDWPHLDHGQIILLIDGESVTLTPYENWHDCETFEGNTTYKESCYYEISKDLLKRICDSKSFGMKLYGGNGHAEISNVNAIVVYSKLFFNAVYDKTAYMDVVANALDQFTRTNADISNFSKIALDGSGANGGCMGMLLLIISMASAAIGGICTLV